MVLSSLWIRISGFSGGFSMASTCNSTKRLLGSGSCIVVRSWSWMASNTSISQLTSMSILSLGWLRTTGVIHYIFKDSHSRMAPNGQKHPPRKCYERRTILDQGYQIQTVVPKHKS